MTGNVREVALAVAAALVLLGCAVQTQSDMCVRQRSCVCVGRECDCQPLQRWECTFHDLELEEQKDPK